MSEQEQEEMVDVNGHQIPRSVHDYIRRGAVNGAQNNFIQALSNQLGANLNLGTKPGDVAKELKKLIDAQVEATSKEAEQKVELEKQNANKTIEQIRAELEAETAQKIMKLQADMKADSFKNSVQQNLLARGLIDEYSSMLPAMIDQFAEVKVTDGKLQIWQPGEEKFKLDANNNPVSNPEDLANMFAQQFPQMFRNPKKMPGMGTGSGTEPQKKGFSIEDAKGKSISDLLKEGVEQTTAALKAGASQVEH